MRTQTEATPFIVTIDGPAGAGKSTVSRTVASELGYTFLDTGALYRAVAWLASQAGVAWTDETGLAGLAADLDVRFERVGDRILIVANAQDVTTLIRTPEISQGSSKISAFPRVRQALLETQRKVARSTSVVAEGRDTGTVVFPHAQVKFFLTATAEVRAERRTRELREAGKPVDYAVVLKEIIERDQRDESRAVAPMKPAADAINVDSSLFSATEVIAKMVAIVRAKGG